MTARRLQMAMVMMYCTRPLGFFGAKSNRNVILEPQATKGGCNGGAKFGFFKFHGRLK